MTKLGKMLYNVSKYIIQIVRYDMLFFKRLGKRGAALTEYAILLAFVAAIGASFTASNGLEDSIRGAIGKAEKVLAAVAVAPKKENLAAVLAVKAGTLGVLAIITIKKTILKTITQLTMVALVVVVVAMWALLMKKTKITMES